MSPAIGPKLGDGANTVNARDVDARHPVAYVALIFRTAHIGVLCAFAMGAGCVGEAPKSSQESVSNGSPPETPANNTAKGPDSRRGAASEQPNLGRRDDVGPAAQKAGAYFREIEVYGERRGQAGVRVVMYFDGEPEFEERRLPADDVLPARFAIAFQDVAWSSNLDTALPVAAGGLTRVRLQRDAQRVVLDLDVDSEATLFSLVDPYRLVVDVRRQGVSANAAPIIVLDPGHGGHEPGAANEPLGLVEAEVALDLAKRTRRALSRKLPHAEVLLTRRRDEHLSLEARCAKANAMAADAFVSIHLNAGPPSVKKGGITTFVLDSTNDRQALRLAARENGTHSRRVTGAQAIFAHLHRRSQMRGSRALAERIQRATLRQARSVLPAIADRGVRSAMFYVLVGATMPAVLVEASFLTIDQEALALTTDRYRDRLSEGIASGIVTYLELRGSRGHRVRGARR